MFAVAAARAPLFDFMSAPLVMVVVSVRVGVVVALVTVPSKPFASVNVNEVTVPAPAAESVSKRRVTGSKAEFMIVALSTDEVPPITFASLSSIASLPFCVIGICLY